MRNRINHAFVWEDSLYVCQSITNVLRVPIDSISCLKGKSINSIAKFEIDPEGSFLFWEEFDIYLGWDQFLQIVDPKERQKAQEQNRQFNIRYGSAIRRLRESSAIPRNGIVGLDEAQLEQIENGEIRAHHGALECLARSHRMSPNEYLQCLAEELD